jgi:predicted permease
MATDSFHLLGNARALAFALAMTGVTGLLFGLAPALQASRPDHASVLREASPFGDRRRLTLRGSLVGIQVALSLVLLVGAGLFVRALQRGLALDPGFTTERLAVAATYFGVTRYDSTRAAAYFADAQSRVEAAAGVEGAAWALTAPLVGDVDVRTAAVEGYTPAPDEKIELEVNAVSPEYHRLLGIPIVAGRSFEAGDRPGAAPVVIINETLASRYFAGRDAVGRTITFDGVAMTVVGVARDSKYHELDEPPQPYVYYPFSQQVANTITAGAALIVRARGDAEALLPMIGTALRTAGPDVPVSGLMTVEDRVASILAPQRLGVALLGAFGALALVVAAVGIYGVVAFGVSQRTREIGVRLALGARAADVTRQIVRGNLNQVTAGLAAGVLLALASGRVMASFLYGVSPRDVLTFAAATATMLAVAVAACVVPASRAARADPVRALRD